jgi:DNA-binding LacI/PurR family transcriptional regulator
MAKLLPTPKKVLDAADKAEDKYLDALQHAPIKRGWNKTFGISIPSKSDALREYNSTMRGLQEFCESRGYEGILKPEKEEKAVQRIREE